MLLDQDAVGLGRVLFLGHVHALLVALPFDVGEDELLDRLRELHELGLLQDGHLLTKSSCALIVFARFAAASTRNRIPTSALSFMQARPAMRKMLVSTDAMLRNGIVCVDEPSGITPRRVFGLLHCTRMLLAAMLVLNQNRITDGLNRSPVMLVSLVSFL